MQIIVSKDYSSDQRKVHFINLTSFFASCQLDKIRPFLHEDVHWSLVGDDLPIEGRDNFLAALNKMKGNTATELIIHQVIVEDHKAAISGEMVMNNGQIYVFVDIYTQHQLYFDITQSIQSFVAQKSTI